MSANIDTMLYVGETPWHGLGKKYDTPPTSAAAIIEGAQLGWGVDAAPMMTEMHGRIGSYHAVYRKDTNDVLGVINRHPYVVQNADAFTTFDHLINNTVDTETAASINRGAQVFSCFKVRDTFKCIDDDIDHYFVVLNDHTKSDGKITVLNTPVRVVCQNTLSAALNRNFYSIRVPVSPDISVSREMANRIINGVDSAILNLNKVADKWVITKVDTSLLEKILDELFPFQQCEGESLINNKHNENVAIVRDTFQSCLDKPDLANYEGTVWWVYNAVADFAQHYFKKVDKAYDLTYRMQRLKGVGVASEPSLEQKFMSIAYSIFK